MTTGFNEAFGRRGIEPLWTWSAPGAAGIALLRLRALVDPPDLA